MESFRQDLGAALRALGRRPAFTLLATGTLAIGLGATTAIYSVVDAVLLRPLPYQEPASLVTFWSTNRDSGGQRGTVSYADFRDWDEGSSLTTLVAYHALGLSLTGLGDAEMVPAAVVSAGFFDVFRTLPI